MITEVTTQINQHRHMNSALNIHPSCNVHLARCFVLVWVRVALINVFMPFLISQSASLAADWWKIEASLIRKYSLINETFPVLLCQRWGFSSPLVLNFADIYCNRILDVFMSHKTENAECNFQKKNGFQ